MKHIIHSLMRRLDLRVSRASSIESLLAETAASKQKAAALQLELAAALEFRDTASASPQGDEPIDHILEQIPGDGSALALPEFANACAAYSALRTMRAREKVSEHLLTSLLASNLPGLPSDSAAQSLASHELYRQAAATRSFATGLLDQSADKWKQLSDELPSPFNLACHARVLLANDDKPRAFAVLADGIDRYPRDVLLAIELATFFARLGDTDAANTALDGVRHAFLDERNALAMQQADLDRSIDQGRISQAGRGDRKPASDRELRNQPAREAALRTMICRIVRESNVTTLIAFGASGGAFAEPLPDLQQVRLMRLGEDEVLTADVAGSSALLFHAGIAETSYPARLAPLYRQCRELGIAHLMIGERLDFDRDSLRYHEGGHFPRITRLGGQGRFLHDFKKLLDEAGYIVAESTAVAPGPVPARAVPDAGYRWLHAVPRP